MGKTFDKQIFFESVAKSAASNFRKKRVDKFEEKITTTIIVTIITNQSLGMAKPATVVISQFSLMFAVGQRVSNSLSPIKNRLSEHRFFLCEVNNYNDDARVAWTRLCVCACELYSCICVHSNTTNFLYDLACTHKTSPSLNSQHNFLFFAKCSVCVWVYFLIVFVVIFNSVEWKKSTTLWHLILIGFFLSFSSIYTEHFFCCWCKTYHP